MRLRLFIVALIVALLGGGLGAAAWAWQLRSIARQTQFDQYIGPAALENNIDPLLIRAIIWRESRFQPRVRGLNRERGLMQLTPGVAAEWARVRQVDPVDPDALFDPKVNIEIGTWYFARMLKHWEGVENAEVFALAEYNAGRSNVLKWVDPAAPTDAAALHDRIGFPSTRRYVDAILVKYEAYQRNYFRPPWLLYWDRLTKKSDQPTLVGSAAKAL
ncbi:soluble lytic murein transglycosylase [Verrucomicrobium sp. GAS474]|uniref:lytic transglycosylase domain-containing protein n=1 Tax=Verrucomicrobium sp. GAS474 TaxID=1882831 RepID=UPI00087BF0AA|nr:lytic transglycosylase domain-containing protein [Verrucomicrobium sp. GAS474]SDT92021.1 soluble lytic murein transglycosylase [Verrucomicrobium sp. GAS474]